MDARKRLIAMLVLPATGFVSTVAAEPYQIEATVSFAQFDASFQNGGSLDGDVLSVTATYFLQIVDTTEGPLSERAFLDKSAFVAGSMTQTKPDRGNDLDVIGLDARFVTQEDLIVELGYSKIDTGSGSDGKTLELGVGKYLDGKTTAVFFYESDDDDVDVDTFGARYRRLVEGSAPNTNIAYEAGLAYVDAPDDSGFEIGLGGTYYLSEQLSVGAGFEYRDIGDFDETSILLSVDNFFTDTVFAGLAFSRNSDSNDTDIDFIGVQAGARF